jgi:hypothetical protein
MIPYLFAFLVLPDGAFQVAVRLPSGTNLTSTFLNTEDGVNEMVRWLVSEAHFTQESDAHSCLAIAVGDDAHVYSTPVFEFAYHATVNTVVWASATRDAIFASTDLPNRTALVLLSKFADEQARSAA